MLVVCMAGMWFTRGRRRLKKGGTSVLMYMRMREVFWCCVPLLLLYSGTATADVLSGCLYVIHYDVATNSTDSLQGFA